MRCTGADAFKWTLNADSSRVEPESQGGRGVPGNSRSGRLETKMSLFSTLAHFPGAKFLEVAAGLRVNRRPVAVGRGI